MYIPQDILEKLQIQFHKLVDSRAKHLMHLEGNSYPDLKKYNGQEMYHRIGGMYGDFSYEIKKEGDEYILHSSSLNRCCGGSGQIHRVTIDSYEQIASFI